MLILANHLRGGVLGFAHLEHRVVSMDSSLLAVFAEIVVSAHRAHVTNAADGGHVAAIADNTVKYCVALLLLLINQIFLEHGLEFCSAVLTNFFTDHLNDRTDLLRADNTTAIALAARKPLLVGS